MLVNTIYCHFLDSTVTLHRHTNGSITIFRQESILSGNRFTADRINSTSVNCHITMLLILTITQGIFGSCSRNITTINFNGKRSYICLGFRSSCTDTGSISTGLRVNITTINDDFSTTASALSITDTSSISPTFGNNRSTVDNNFSECSRICILVTS